MTYIWILEEALELDPDVSRTYRVVYFWQQLLLQFISGKFWVLTSDYNDLWTRKYQCYHYSLSTWNWNLFPRIYWQTDVHIRYFLDFYSALRVFAGYLVLLVYINWKGVCWMIVKTNLTRTCFLICCPLQATYTLSPSLQTVGFKASWCASNSYRH